MKTLTTLLLASVTTFGFALATNGDDEKLLSPRAKELQTTQMAKDESCICPTDRDLIRESRDMTGSPRGRELPSPARRSAPQTTQSLSDTSTAARVPNGSLKSRRSKRCGDERPEKNGACNARAIGQPVARAGKDAREAKTTNPKDSGRTKIETKSLSALNLCDLAEQKTA